MTLLSQTFGAEIPERIQLHLAADPVLTSHLGDFIRVHETDDPRPLPTPYLKIIAGKPDMKGFAAQRVNADYRTLLKLYLPRPTWASKGVPIPATAPVPSLSAGDLTGDWRWAWTAYDALGRESWCGPPSDRVTLTDQRAFLPVPAYVDFQAWIGLRLWRTESGLEPLRYRATLRDLNAGGLYDDGEDRKLGEELAPVKGYKENLVGAIEMVLFKNMTLPDLLDEPETDATIDFKVIDDSVDERRNQQVTTIEVTHQLQFKPDTMETTVGEED